MKKVIGVLSAILICFGLIGCAGDKENSNKQTDNNKLNVVVSIYPLEQFTKMIGGDKVNVLTLVGAGQEPHDFEIKPADFKELANSDIFVYNGLGLEEWLDKVQTTKAKRKIKEFGKNNE